MRGVSGVEIGYETIRLASDDTGPIGPQLHVLRATDPIAVALRVEETGGRVLRIHEDESILVVELPVIVSPASVGADEVQVRTLSTDHRGVTASWQPVVAAS
ncbi:MAG: hypothetical protein ACR2QO_18460 [Acidimicrobiales bacterium]